MDPKLLANEVETAEARAKIRWSLMAKMDRLNLNDQTS